MSSGENSDARERLRYRIARSAEANADPDFPGMDEFAALQEEVDELELDELVEDPEYLEFADRFSALEGSEVDAELHELVGGEPDRRSGKETDGGPEGPDGAPVDGRTGRSAAESDGSGDGATAAGGSAVVDELVRALESDAVSDAQRAALREALGVGERTRTDVQLNYLKSRFLDLEAYLHAMEEFFDGEPHPREELDALREELSELRSEVETLRERLDDADRRTAAVAARQEAQDEALESLDRSVDRTRATLRRNLSVIEDELNRNRRWRKRVSEAVRDLEGDGGRSSPGRRE